jgi:hypothetical protein
MKRRRDEQSRDPGTAESIEIDFHFIRHHQLPPPLPWATLIEGIFAGTERDNSVINWEDEAILGVLISNAEAETESNWIRRDGKSEKVDARLVTPINAIDFLPLSASFLCSSHRLCLNEEEEDHWNKLFVRALAADISLSHCDYALMKRHGALVTGSLHSTDSDAIEESRRLILKNLFSLARFSEHPSGCSRLALHTRMVSRDAVGGGSFQWTRAG